METRTAEVADGIYQLTTHVADIDFCFNQYLVTGDEPLLFHTGGRQFFPLIKDAVTKVLPAQSVRWISFGHVESDECGSMNDWLTAAPNATVTASGLACMVSLGDLCIRPPEPFADGQTRDLGGHVVRWIDTPHTPHGWESGLLYDETTKTLFCGDLFTATGTYQPTSDVDPIGPAMAAEDMFGYSCLAPQSPARIRQLAELEIDTLALMHGAAYTGDCRAALLALADDTEKRIANAQ